jgi:transcriptional regulator with XRE-family HTH domain
MEMEVITDLREVTGQQLYAGRALLRGLEQRFISEQSGVSVPSLRRIERGEPARAANIIAVASVLEKLGIIFFDRAGG